MSVQKIISILLADDDEDDCLLFKEVLRELPIVTTLFIVHDGQKLMEALNTKTGELPDVLFMDLSMPVKDGFECMSEIRNNDMLRHLPVVILSTHSNQDIVAQIYLTGADYYVRKPGEFSELQSLVLKSLMLVLKRQDDVDNN